MTDDERESLARGGAATAATAASKRGEITSAELLRGAREIRILHADAIYTLRQTSKGKLILTK
jgi:hemin uptake protein HemP